MWKPCVLLHNLYVGSFSSECQLCVMIPPAIISLWTNKVSLKEQLKFTSQVCSIFCSHLELLSRTAAGNWAYVSGHHNTTSRRIHTWFFISQWTLRETSNFRLDRIVAQKFVAYYRTPQTISRKFARIKTIDVAKSWRKIANCQRDFFSSEISSKSANFAEVRLHYFFTIL